MRTAKITLMTCILGVCLLIFKPCWKEVNRGMTEKDDKIERLHHTVCTSLHFCTQPYPHFFSISIFFFFSVNYWPANLVLGPLWDSAASAWQVYLFARAPWRPHSGHACACVCPQVRVQCALRACRMSAPKSGCRGCRAGRRGGGSFSVALAW